MTKRLQVLLDESELREIQLLARAQRVTVAEWVRGVLRTARRQQPTGEAGKKLEIVRSAARYAYPTADIDAMLGEIERGYIGKRP